MGEVLVPARRTMLRRSATDVGFCNCGAALISFSRPDSIHFMAAGAEEPLNEFSKEYPKIGSVQSSAEMIMNP